MAKDNFDTAVEESFNSEDIKSIENVSVGSVGSVTSDVVYLTLCYEDTDFVRRYKFNNVASSALSSVADNVRAYNANIPAADKAIFISDDGNHMVSIAGATIERTITDYLSKR